MPSPVWAPEVVSIMAPKCLSWEGWGQTLAPVELGRAALLKGLCFQPLRPALKPNPTPRKRLPSRYLTEQPRCPTSGSWERVAYTPPLCPPQPGGHASCSRSLLLPIAGALCLSSILCVLHSLISPAVWDTSGQNGGAQACSPSEPGKQGQVTHCRMIHRGGFSSSLILQLISAAPHPQLPQNQIRSRLSSWRHVLCLPAPWAGTGLCVRLNITLALPKCHLADTGAHWDRGFQSMGSSVQVPALHLWNIPSSSGCKLSCVPVPHLLQAWKCHCLPHFWGGKSIRSPGLSQPGYGTSQSACFFISPHQKMFFGSFPQTLLELGASPDYKDSYGLTPLYHTAIVGGDPYCCELLLHEHASVCCKDENGWHEIHQVWLHLHLVHLSVSFDPMTPRCHGGHAQIPPLGTLF